MIAPRSPSLWALPETIINPERIDRFWSHVKVSEGDGCWLWTGERRERRGAKKGGYGVFVIEAGGLRVRFRAHRFAWEVTYGPIPEGQLIRHKCDVRLCCRPDHLEPGTNRENVYDMMRRGRHMGAPPKFTPEEVQEIRRRMANGEGPTAVGNRFGVKKHRIRDIQRGKAYAWVAADDNR